MATFSVRVRKLNKRRFPVTNTADKSNVVAIVVAGYTFNGSFAQTNICGDWYKDDKGYYYWGGGLNIPQTTETIKAAIALPPPVVAPVTAPAPVRIPVVQPLFTVNSLLSDYGIPSIWKKINGKGAGVSVAVIDTGLNYLHPAFASKQNIQYYNVIANSAKKEDCMDIFGHGTACAGVIASQLADVSGVAPDVNLIVIKATMNGGFEAVNTANAIHKAIDLGAQIISVSHGYNPGDNGLQALMDAVSRANDNKVLIVASAPDSGDNSAGQIAIPVYPASYQTCIGVGACTLMKDFASYTQVINGMKILSPGTMNVLGLNGYKTGNGTSYATPFVAATLALYLSEKGVNVYPDILSDIQRLSSDKQKINAQIKALYPGVTDIDKLGIIAPLSLF